MKRPTKIMIAAFLGEAAFIAAPALAAQPAPPPYRRGPTTAPLPPITRPVQPGLSSGRQVRIPRMGAQIRTSNGQQQVLYNGRWIPLIGNDGSTLIGNDGST